MYMLFFCYFRKKCRSLLPSLPTAYLCISRNFKRGREAMDKSSDSDRGPEALSQTLRIFIHKNNNYDHFWLYFGLKICRFETQNLHKK